jgi:hypothetical protein
VSEVSKKNIIIDSIRILTPNRAEHQTGTRKRRAELAKAESDISEYDLTAAPVPANPTEHLLQIPGSERALINLSGKGFERSLISKLDWLTYGYVTSRPVSCFIFVLFLFLLFLSPS